MADNPYAAIAIKDSNPYATIALSNSPEPDYSHPAGLGGQAAPTVVAHPGVDMHEAHGVMSLFSNPGALADNNSSITPQSAQQSSQDLIQHSAPTPLGSVAKAGVASLKNELSPS